MILDALAKLSSSQALTAGTTVSTDKYDLGNVTPRRDVGAGEPMAVVVTVEEAAAGSTDTFDFQLVSDEDAALGSPTVHLTRRVAKALLVEGAMLVLDIPPAPHNYERYLGARYIVGSGDSITVSAHICPRNHIPAQAYYATAFEV